MSDGAIGEDTFASAFAELSARIARLGKPLYQQVCDIVLARYRDWLAGDRTGSPPKMTSKEIREAVAAQPYEGVKHYSEDTVGRAHNVIDRMLAELLRDGN